VRSLKSKKKKQKLSFISNLKKIKIRKRFELRK
jgi:hypothetical protein